MSIIDRYVARYLVSGWLFMFALLAILFGLFTLIEELERTLHDYQVPQVLLYVLLTTPQRTLDLFPIIVLLGTLLGYAGLARNQELLVIQTLGLSRKRQLLSALLPGVLLMLLLWMGGEWLAAPLYQKAETQRQTARGGVAGQLPDSGLWAGDGRRFVQVSQLTPDYQARNIQIFEMDAAQQLQKAVRADSAESLSAQRWALHDARIKTNTAGRLETRTEVRLETEAPWSMQTLRSLTLTPAAMSLHNLYRHLQQLQSHNQNPGNLPYLFWQRLLLPLVMLAMILLACQFSFRLLQQRDHKLGRRMAAGVAVSLAFYLLSQIIHASGILLQIDPRITALLPILLILLATLPISRWQT